MTPVETAWPARRSRRVRHEARSFYGLSRPPGETVMKGQCTVVAAKASQLMPSIDGFTHQASISHPSKTLTRSQTSDQGPGTKDQEPGIRDQEPGIRDQGPGPSTRGPETRDEGPRTSDDGPRTRKQKPEARDQGPEAWTRDPGGPGNHGPRDQGSGDQGTRLGQGTKVPETRGKGPGMRDQGLGPGTRDQGPGTKDQGTKDQGPRDKGPGTKDQGSGTRDWDQGHGPGQGTRVP